MHKLFSLFLLTILIGAFCVNENVWPVPKYRVFGDITRRFDPHFKFVFPKGDCDALKYAIPKYSKIFKTASLPEVVSKEVSPTPLTQIAISIDSCDTTKLDIDINEAYALYITSSSPTIAITAETYVGALYALETLAQLIYIDETGPFIRSVPIRIEDQPRLKWRGMMLDSARHFLTVSKIKEMMEIMVTARFNVFHWHLTDAQAIPLGIHAMKDVAHAAAYSTRAIYSRSDIEEIVQFGLVRGIKVMPEIDVPGHSYAWGLYDKEFVSQCPDRYAKNINNWPMNPASDKLMNMLTQVFAEFKEIFPFSHAHIGFDEPCMSCWTQSKTKSVQDFIKKTGLDGRGIYNYFLDKMSRMVTDSGLTPVGWGEIYRKTDGKAPKSMIVEAWAFNDFFKEAIQKGYKVLLAHGFYLDQQVPSPSRTTHYLWGDTFYDFLGVDPLNGLSKEEQKSVLGGEIPMWGEQVNNRMIVSRVFPRAFGASATFWSDVQEYDVTATRYVINDLSCRMNGRGHDMGPMYAGYCMYADVE
ncbi:hypothetical protein PCE1_001358 [Barthelona sp. PCE]